MSRYELHLQAQPFESIKAKRKKIEMRLYDEKRQKYSVGDELLFTKVDSEEKLLTKIKDLKRYKNFDELYKNNDKIDLGYADDEEAKPDDMNKYYSTEQQKKYGVLGIEIEVIEE